MVNLKKYKERFLDWWYPFYYRITELSIRRFWHNISRWFSYYKVIRNTYDFDYSSLLEVEYHQLTKLRDCISKYQSHVNAWRDIRDMNWALACLKIVLENGCAYFNGEQGPDEKGYYELNHRWIMPIYVNDRNAKRFWEYYQTDDLKLSNLHKDYLRIEKAWYLYNKIRKESLRNWWD